MILWLKWFFSPVGRAVAGVGLVFSVLFAAYMKGRREGAASLKQEQDDERLRRSRAALEAGDAARRDAASGGLLNNDGHRRD